ncbi:NAD(+) synthase [Candidatus Stoquefichus massiliensis]|uniref:NAD(+) synthase n=1 Tax=Candidatus Stoquefichus massiliensis TaxID=1470350 RepID=UPI000483E503|nr:NAD(+) synthase [Candidatus Stoquefichus massiliensis]
MKDGFVRVGCASFEIQLGQVKENAKHIIEYAQKASQDHVKVLVFPELCLTGYTIEDLFYQKRIINEVYAQIDEILDLTYELDMFLVIGAPLIHMNKLYNCAIVICDGEILGVIPKTFIPTYHEFYEGRHFASAPKETTEILINGDYYPFGTDIIFESHQQQHLKIAVEICEDLWAPLPPSTRHCLNGATLILNPSASNNLTTKSDYRRLLVSSHSARLVCGYAYCNAGLGESTTDVVFSNHHIIAENGTLLEESIQYEEGYIYTDLDLDKLLSERIEMTTYTTQNDDYLYVPFEIDTEELEIERYYDPHPFVPSRPEERALRCKEVFDIQIYGLIQRLKAARIKKVVIGISGGLDSTLALLVASMAYQKLGYPSTDIIAVTMPCFGTTSRTKNNALKMMDELKVTSQTVDITKAVLQHFEDIGHDENIHDVTYENTQARERTQVLMDIANQEGGIVIGTGDLSEVALGWSTYNGDHMSMYAVNVSVPKTLVRYLVDYVSSLYQGQPLETILQDILDTPVSPELLPAQDNEIVQKTEDIVGPYELHDFFLYHHVRFHYEPRKLFRIAKLAFKDQYDQDTIKKWLTLFYRRFFTQQFKRTCIPDGPKVGSVALSPRGDLRMPSDANVQLWLDECEKL